MSSATLRRKLIDIQPVVFEKLTVKAGREGVSLKRYIENLLEKVEKIRRGWGPSFRKASLRRASFP